MKQFVKCLDEWDFLDYLEENDPFQWNAMDNIGFELGLYENPWGNNVELDLN